MNKDLYHYGIPGMKWGQRKEKFASAAKKVGKAAWDAAKKMGNEFKTSGYKYAKAAVRDVAEGFKEVYESIKPGLKKGYEIGKKVFEKIKDFKAKNFSKETVRKGKNATNSGNFDDLYKQSMADVRKIQQDIENAARRGASTEEQARMGNLRDAALLRAKEYKRQREKR